MGQATIKRPRILYAIQGTGNGHLARALTLIPELSKHADVDVLLSGIQVDLELPFEVKYRLKGLSFIFGQNGGIDLWKMMRKVNLLRYATEVQMLRLKKYNLVLNDFEPVSAWASFQQNVPCIQFSHQAAVGQNEAPKPIKEEPIGKLILRYYAPSEHQFGFHFQQYNEQTFTPIIRDEVRKVYPSHGKHITVYLPAFSNEKICALFSKFKYEEFHIFSKHCTKTYKKNNCKVMPIQNQAFVQSMASSNGVICGAGFETPAEVMYFKKKLLVVPMSQQYEQHCNAEALKHMGVKVLHHLDDESYNAIQTWLFMGKAIRVHFNDNKSDAIQTVLEYANRTFFDNRFCFKFDKEKTLT